MMSSKVFCLLFTLCWCGQLKAGISVSNRTLNQEKLGRFIKTNFSKLYINSLLIIVNYLVFNRTVFLTCTSEP